MIRILVDSAADFQTAELKEKNIEMVPLTITVDDNKNYQDEIDITRGDLYRMMIEEGRSVKTSQPSPQSFADAFEKIKAAGDEVICITLSSTLSGTYQSACLAKEIVDYDKIYIIDSLSATHAVRIMTETAQKMIDKGVSAQEIVEKLEVLKKQTRIVAAVDTLKYLYLGGRVSRTTAIVADAVSIKPAITIDSKGAVEVCGKYLGVGRAVKDIVKKVATANIDPEYPVYLIYSYDIANVQKLEKALVNAGIKADGCYELGATLGVHVGPRAFGIIFIEKEA